MWLGKFLANGEVWVSLSSEKPGSWAVNVSYWQSPTKHLCWKPWIDWWCHSFSRLRDENEACPNHPCINCKHLRWTELGSCLGSSSFGISERYQSEILHILTSSTFPSTFLLPALSPSRERRCWRLGEAGLFCSKALESSQIENFKSAFSLSGTIVTASSYVGIWGINQPGRLGGCWAGERRNSPTFSSCLLRWEVRE